MYGLVWGPSNVSLRDQLTGIDANLDDLESGVDAGSREADHIRQTAAKIERLQLKALESADLLGRLVRHAQELQICVRDQREAMQEPGPRLDDPDSYPAGRGPRLRSPHGAACGVTSDETPRRTIGTRLERVREQQNLLLAEQLARQVQRGRRAWRSRSAR